MSVAAVVPLTASDLRRRPAGLLRDISTVAGRALRAIPREAENILPSIVMAMFFFLVNIGTLDELTSQIPGFDYPSFQLPTSVLLGVTGVTRAYAFVIDTARHRRLDQHVVVLRRAARPDQEGMSRARAGS
jgi:ABC-2 type transport system permease protein